jgi:uncharacterized metal-binding protein YceD (DUF177 family)
MSGTPEFARPFRLDTIGGEARSVTIAAEESERTALAERFGLIAIDRLEAEATLRREGASVWATGHLRGAATQSCTATGDPIPAKVDERFALRFDPAGREPAEDEIELEEADLDVLPYDGSAIDLGEAVAQGFSLALDPFPRVADADERLRAAGIRTEEEADADKIASSPFAALKGLSKD